MIKQRHHQDYFTHENYMVKTLINRPISGICAHLVLLYDAMQQKGLTACKEVHKVVHQSRPVLLMAR
jgi:hypothetical protein